METREKTMEVLARDLGNEIDRIKAIMESSSEALMEMNPAGVYHQVEDNYACASLMMFHLSTLDKIVKEGNYKQTENFIRFTIYQFERTTDRRILEDDADATDESNCGLIRTMLVKPTLYRKFKRFLSYFETPTIEKINRSLACSPTPRKAI